MTVYIVMGVAGCGKSTIGRLAAQDLKVPFLEGDDFHGSANIAKMTSDIPLTDEDRLPWVDEMVDACQSAWAASENRKTPIILACSALTKIVRSRLRGGLNGDCHFIHLHGDIARIRQRMIDRKGHFFKPHLLSSQFEALDIPDDATTLDVDLSKDELVKQLCAVIRSENET